MIYAKKKVQKNADLAAQTAKIIANVKEMEQKNVLRIEGQEVFLYPGLWKDRLTALNWMRCLHVYCMAKKGLKERDTLHFKHYETGAMIGSLKNKKATLEVTFS